MSFYLLAERKQISFYASQEQYHFQSLFSILMHGSIKVPLIADLKTSLMVIAFFAIKNWIDDFFVEIKFETNGTQCQFQ